MLIIGSFVELTGNYHSGTLVKFLMNPLSPHVEYTFSFWWAGGDKPGQECKAITTFNTATAGRVKVDEFSLIWDATHAWKYQQHEYTFTLNEASSFFQIVVSCLEASEGAAFIFDDFIIAPPCGSTSNPAPTCPDPRSYNSDGSFEGRLSDENASLHQTSVDLRVNGPNAGDDVAHAHTGDRYV